ncbi:EAL domain-containing protein [Salinimonas marina]|uniref:EAL domain-containing protein n=1 Tax=Salinimonas marina TaxID=2785918 RepID=A0A7S9HDY8_9ALTE|nr:EAL domain-containing protein [Salinimonas marina]QPG06756.1 EAL domain-containing protein [Salinimonas marina]
MDSYSVKTVFDLFRFLQVAVRALRGPKTSQNLLLIWLGFSLYLSTGAIAAPVLSEPQFKRLSTHQGLTQDTILDILIDNDGFVWFATEGGLGRWDGYNFLTIKGPNDVFVNASIEKLFLDSAQKLWISTLSSGVYTLDLHTQAINRIIDRQARSETSWSQTGRAFIEDSNSNIYVALDHEVVFISARDNKPKTLAVLPQPLRDKDNLIRDIWLTDKYLYIASSSGLFAKRRDMPQAPLLPIEYLPLAERNISNLNSKFLWLDRQQRFWVATVQGVFAIPLPDLEAALDKNTQARFTAVDETLNVWEVVQKEDDSFWLASSSGLYSLKQNASGTWQKIHILQPDAGDVELAKKTIRTLAQDKGGNLWLGTELGGALFWSPETLTINTIQNHLNRETDVLSDNTVWSFHQSDANTLWVGTANGLTRLALDTMKSDFFLQSGDSYSNIESEITDIVPAPDGKLFLRTFEGIRLFDPAANTLSFLPTNRAEDDAVVKAGTYSMSLGPDGWLYIMGHSFFRYNPKSYELEPLPFAEQGVSTQTAIGFLGFSEKLGNQMLFATSDALWLLDTHSLQSQILYKYQALEKNNSVAISSWGIDDFNTLWLGFPRFGLIGIDLQSREVTHRFNSDNVLNTNVVYGVTLDKANNIWFSSHQGVYRFSPRNQLIKNYSYGKELTVSEFNDGASVLLEDGKIAFGSTRGVVIFDPMSLINNHDQPRIKQSMAITGVGLSSRALTLPLNNLNGRHLEMAHNDFGIVINFSSMVSDSAGRENYLYTLSRDQNIVSQDVTTNGVASFAFLAPGKYRFEVRPATAHFSYDITPASITFTIAYPPFRSPFAYAMYAMGALILLFLYFSHRQQQLRRQASTERQLRLMGQAFRQTRDWVVVFDPDSSPIAANPAFCAIFGLNSKAKLNHQWEKLRLKRPELPQKLQAPLKALQPGEFLKEETQLAGVNGQQFDVLIDITAVTAEEQAGQVDHFLVVISDISEQKRAERKLLKLASFDNLTGLVNRSLLLDRLEHALAHAANHQLQVAVLFVDLDRFKSINDTLGHDYGDKLLKVIAGRMQNLASKDDTVARLGGDEFVIVLEDVGRTQHINSFVGKLIEAVETPISLGEEIISTSCSVGIAFYPEDAGAPSELLKQADVAMYSAKKDKVNRFTYYTSELNERAREQLKLENRVKRAYQQNAFENHYQPIMDALTSKPEGVELLLRCNMDDEALYPDQFIPVLEQLRYIVDVTRHAISRALDDAQRWRASGFTGYVAINISALQFRANLHLELLCDAMAARGLPRSALRFEITEGALMEDSSRVVEQLKTFQNAGFKLALDDFGTGYSSLSYLRRFPLDVLKIDRSFIMALGQNAQADALVETSIKLAQTFNMECVAEGVEEPGQAGRLTQMGCHIQQGYLYAKAMPAHEIDTLFERHFSSPDSTGAKPV